MNEWLDRWFVVPSVENAELMNEMNEWSNCWFVVPSVENAEWINEWMIRLLVVVPSIENAELMNELMNDIAGLLSLV